MRVLIPCFSVRGHHLQFTIHLARAASTLGATPVLLLPRSAGRSGEFAAHIGNGGVGEIHELLSPLRPGSLMSAVRQRLEVRRLTAQLRCDRLWVHFADSFALGDLLLGSRKWPIPIETLFLHGRYAYSEMDRSIGSGAIARTATLSGRWDTVWHLDPVSSRYLRKQGFPVGLMPEPVEPPVSADVREVRRRLGLPDDRIVIGVLGNLDERKGIRTVANAFLRLRPRNLTLALLGKVDASIRTELADMIRGAPRGSIIHRDEVLSKEDFEDALIGCDWHSVVYPRHFGSSGILARACANNRPVLASSFGWIGEATRRYGLGHVCDATSVDAVAEQLDSISREPVFRFSESSDAFRRFNTIENFGAHWTVKLRRALGSGDHPGLVQLPL